MTATRQLGEKGEKIVANYLINKNFEIIAKNYRKRIGEIDLIAQKGDYLIFVEVKTRRSNYFPISNTVSYSKQRKIIKTAELFILSNKINNKVFRFDVASVLYQNGKYNINYIENAFN